MVKPVAKLKAQWSYIAIGFLLLCFQASADDGHFKSNDQSLNKLELSVVELSVTPTTLTPGQQLNIVLKIRYADKVEMVFNAQQVDWQAFTLLNSHDASPQWFDNHWQKQYNISLSVPVAGQYQLPLFTIDSYLAEHHKQLSTSAQTIKVLKTVTLLKNADSSSPSLDQAEQDSALTLPTLQDIERISLDYNAQQNATQLIFIIAVFIIAMLIFSSLIAYGFVRLKRKKRLLQQQVTPTTQQALLPTQLIKTFKNNGYCDWQQLQQWLEQKMLEQSRLPAQAAMKQQYQQLIIRLQHLRFSVDNQQHFPKLCQQCQQLHDDSEQNMLKNIRTCDGNITSSVQSN